MRKVEMRRSELPTSVVMWSGGVRKRVPIIIRKYTEQMKFDCFFISFLSIVYHYIYGCMFCMFLFNFVYLMYIGPCIIVIIEE